MNSDEAITSIIIQCGVKLYNVIFDWLATHAVCSSTITEDRLSFYEQTCMLKPIVCDYDMLHCKKYPYIQRIFCGEFNVGPRFVIPSIYGYKRLRDRFR